ncbi:LytR C-terminal domain-containing protein [Propioniciclava coleopterorum]|uniref:LytR C-terminal domain-containing protein n=1 Tax=Propioniciclava coleopterorum TaxID=2714937 RepID=A0A6G7Y5H7_9ACTN|nr:LytR C-terminal domain-containing protein [Propioniciclava coleopterorum]QIK71926.1 LytR C-terminal domain-containing protein [Propioniciclava coleopterorum]
MDTNQIVRAVKTPVTLVLLAVLVYFAANWGLDAVRKPIPPRPPEPCVVQQIGPELTPDHVYVRVYNGSKTNGLAKRLGSVLSADGFKVVKRVNADRDDYPRSLVVGHSEDSPEVALVRKALTNVDFMADGRIDRTVDVIIGSEQPGAAEQPDLKVPLPDGTACLPKIQTVEVNE